MITARSYCTGYTGLEMAVRAAFGDFTVLSHSEIKPAANVLLAHHYPDIPNLGDMRAIDYGVLEPADLMIGSWPCGPHSLAGKRLGKADLRDLWPEYLRAIKATRPTIWFGENVASVTTNGELRRVVQDLAAIGYVGSWRVLSAADVGACHLRKRCFVIAIDPATYAERVGRPEGRSEHEGQLGRPDASVGSAGLHPLSLLPTPTPTQSMTTGAGTEGREGGLNLQTAVAYLPTPSVADSRNTRNATANRSSGQEHHHAGWTLCDVAHAERWGKYAEAIHRHEQMFGRCAPEPTTGCLTRNGNPQLAPGFVEFMMALPIGWVIDVPDLSRNQRLSLLGDGVVPAQGASAFSFLLDHLARRLGEDVAA